MRRLLPAVAALLATSVLAVPARAAEPLPRQLEGVDVVEKLGERPDLTGELVDHEGRTVAIEDLLDGRRPVLLTFNYYRCTTLCNLQLGALARTLEKFKWLDGERAILATVSIDPNEGSADAAARRARSLSEADRDDLDWTYLVGDEQTVRRLASAVGVTYRYDEKTDQYAHPATVTVLSPTGKITRYLHGLQTPPRDLKMAVLEASDGVVGTPFDRIVLSCYAYDAQAGSYVPVAWRIMRLGGVLIVLTLGGLLAILWRYDVARGRAGHAGVPHPEAAS